LNKLRNSIAILGISTLLWVPPTVAKTAASVEGVKPLVLVILDTSYSMEYFAGEAMTNTPSLDMFGPICEGPGAKAPKKALSKYTKSRLIVAKEILTGTYQDYWCRERSSGINGYAGGLPIYEACSGYGADACTSPKQNFDGLLDIARDTVKFTVMSFDSNADKGTGASGMYSYGPVVGGVNLGIRNEVSGEPNIPNMWDESMGVWMINDFTGHRSDNNTGQLVAPSSDDGFGPLRSRNRLAQYNILTATGDADTGGTPLGPSLEDARWFLMNNSAVKPASLGSVSGDSLAGCRDRTVILVTDGKATDDGSFGYLSTIAAIEALKNTPPTAVRVVVVGFNLEGGGCSADPGSDACFMEMLDPANGGPADAVYIATDARAMATALAGEMAGANTEIQSRTGIAITNATQSSQDLQYQFNASFQTDPSNDINLVGYLDQTVYQCSEACAAVSDGGLSCARDQIPLHDRLNKGSNAKRKLLAVVDGVVHELKPKLVNLAGSKADMERLFAVPQTGTLPRVLPDSPFYDGAGKVIHSKVIIGKASMISHQKKYMRQVIKTVRADNSSSRKFKRMGAISRATPVVQEPLDKGSFPIRSWNAYVETPLDSNQNGYTPQCRPTVLYTGTHDGLIHAFRVDGLAATKSKCLGIVPNQDEEDIGRELWAIIPHTLLKGAHALVDRFHFLMDGELHLRDVLLVRSDPTTADTLKEAKQWRSVLSGGYGKGGRGYFAFDVTNALDGPEVLWEIDPERRCTAAGCTDGGIEEASEFSKLGLTTPRPAYGTVFIDDQEVAIAVLPAGDSLDDTTAEAVGRAVYVVRLDTGKKIIEFSTEVGNVEDLSGSSIALPSAMTGSPSVFSDVPGVVSSRAFMGDAGGRLWRLNLSGASPKAWRLQLFHDPYGDGTLKTDVLETRQPVLGAPALALTAISGHVAVVYGTGNVDYLSDASADPHDGVFSVSEITGIDGEVSVQWNWSRVLEGTEKLTGSPMIFDQTAYFTTYITQPNDACSPGSGRLYGVDFIEASGKPTDSDSTVPRLDEDGDPTTTDLVQYIETGDSIPFGVQAVERPSCSVVGAGGGASSGANKRGDLELLLNVAKGESYSPKTVPPGVAGSDQKTRNITHKLSSSGEMLQSAAWGYVLY
jgi:hypothetical protein